MVFLYSGENQVFFENKNLRTAKKDKPHLIMESPIMKSICNKIKDLSYKHSSVLILGTSGTGRSTIARQIFEENDYKSNTQFLTLNCEGMSYHIIEKKLFGEGETSEGLLKSGTETTLYIKNIDLLIPYLQKKLNDYLSNKKHEKNLPRLICSSSENLSKKVQKDKFSQSLFNLLSTHLIILPLLYERQDDIPFFIEKFNKENGFKGKLNQDAINFLQTYKWHSNIKELQTVCVKMSILYPHKDIVAKQDLALIVKDLSLANANLQYNPNLKLEDIINQYMEKSLRYFKCKKSSAEALGISVKTIYNKIKTGAISEGL